MPWNALAILSMLNAIDSSGKSGVEGPLQGLNGFKAKLVANLAPFSLATMLRNGHCLIASSIFVSYVQQ